MSDPVSAASAPKPEPKHKKKKQPRPFFRKVLVAFFLCLIIAGLGVFWGYQWLDQRFYQAGPLESERAIIIEKGSGVSAIARTLAREGVISHPDLFRVMLRLKDMDTRLQAGEFLFPAGVSGYEAAKILRDGKSVLHQVTIAEGLSSAAIVDLLHETPLLTGTIDFLPAEGSLLPETYSFTRDMSRMALIDQMQQAMAEVLAQAWAERVEGLPLKSAQEALILASIIEKETAVAAERGKVSGVFINRLKKRMRLQTDPTVIYGITLGKKSLGRGLRRSELQADTPYNTYKIFGLPPTPIANPGRDAIFSATQPDKTDALYFVADGSGGHAFSNTLTEHNRNVRKWRKIERQRKE